MPFNATFNGTKFLDNLSDCLNGSLIGCLKKTDQELRLLSEFFNDVASQMRGTTTTTTTTMTTTMTTTGMLFKTELTDHHEHMNYEVL